MKAIGWFHDENQGSDRTAGGETIVGRTFRWAGSSQGEPAGSYLQNASPARGAGR